MIHNRYKTGMQIDHPLISQFLMISHLRWTNPVSGNPAWIFKANESGFIISHLSVNKVDLSSRSMDGFTIPQSMRMELLNWGV
ncbi:hypothetical protein SAMN04487897_10329 [Paenibacillus sp. yr247]|uniref:hypothetical protein n=1 Tax=Paenibacillus sp. yr247 TaxID=1761880 RepID=UPI00088C44D0|nr:hypothetical protein [Paenibacillus sp. yr247]SDN51503.1 hypothetical protein SAMN04487897_10329 [Paenibacillus sp. yr247]